jgi:hypothetical protein
LAFDYDDEYVVDHDYDLDQYDNDYFYHIEYDYYNHYVYQFDYDVYHYYFHDYYP